MLVLLTSLRLRNHGHLFFPRALGHNQLLKFFLHKSRTRLHHNLRRRAANILLEPCVMLDPSVLS